MKAKLNQTKPKDVLKLANYGLSNGILKVSRSVCDMVATALINKLGRMIMF